MSFSSWSDFLHMGGYAFYVWTSYAITLLVLGGMILAPLLRHRRLRRDMIRRQRRVQKPHEFNSI